MKDSACVFNKGGFCSALAVDVCPKKCSFFKTPKQNEQDLERANQLLQEKGLVCAVKSGERGSIMSTKKVK